MTLVDAASLAEVLDPGEVLTMADALTTVANTVVTAFGAARGRWRDLRDVFDVRGADGIHWVLDGPDEDAAEFATALNSARNALWEAGSSILPGLRARRDELAARIGAVNRAHADADAEYARADAAYWSMWRIDRESAGTTTARVARAHVARLLAEASDAGDALRADIERFRREVEGAEGLIAAQLRGIAGGTDVYGAAGDRVEVSQAYWGVVDGPPGVPAYAVTTLTLAGRLQRELSDAVAHRIGWLGSADPDAVRAWWSAHPDFASAVGLVDPRRAARLWAGLVADSSTRGAADGESTSWAHGPLAQLLLLAPLAVGNLNGVPAHQRDAFNRVGLAQLISDDSIGDLARAQLRALRRALLLSPSAGAALLTLSIDTDGEPRATIAYGDVENSDLLVSVTHGIETDFALLDDWTGTAVDMHDDIAAEASRRGYAPRSGRETVAVLAYFGWDSGTFSTVFDMSHADAGAAEYAGVMSGLQARNPDAVSIGWFHSYGTTMAAQALVDQPTLLDGAFFFGSAGISPEAAAALPDLGAAGGVEVFAGHADKDWTAPLGRSFGSMHRTNPGDLLDDAHVFGANGGIVDFGPGRDGSTRLVEGLPTDGHASHTGNPWYEWTGEEVGYFDRRSQSYLGAVDGAADMLTGAR